MAKLVTLANLKLRCREAADMIHSQFVTDPELIRYINSSAQELYDILVLAYGEDYYVSNTPYEFISDGTPKDLPADFYKAVGVDALIGGGNYITLKPFEFTERNRFNGPTNLLINNNSPLRYKIQGNKITWAPGTSGNNNIRVWYIPVMTELAIDADTLDGVNGYEELVIIDTAIKMKTKQEDDVSVLMARKQELLRRIEKVSQDRDAGMSHRVTDTSRINNYYMDSLFY